MKATSANKQYKVRVNYKNVPWRLKAKNCRDAAKKGEQWYEKQMFQGECAVVEVYNDVEEKWYRLVDRCY